MKSVRLVWNMIKDVVFPMDKRHRKALAGLSILPSLFVLKENKNGILFGFLYTNELVRDCIVSLKNWGDQKIAKAFAETLNDVLFEIIAEEREFSEKKIIVTVIPISKAKKRVRGFNQCELVLFELEKVSKIADVSFDPAAIQTIRETEDQVGKSKTERKENLKGVFVANKEIVKNSIVFIIDDVTTTGATLLEAKRALKEAGVAKIIPIALAH